MMCLQGSKFFSNILAKHEFFSSIHQTFLVTGAYYVNISLNPNVSIGTILKNAHMFHLYALK